MCKLEERIKILARINGYDKAKLLMIEEIAELSTELNNLTKAIIKAERNANFTDNDDIINLKEEDIHNIVSEVADVSIVLDEIVTLLDIERQVNLTKCFKTNRAIKGECKIES